MTKKHRNTNKKVVLILKRTQGGDALFAFFLASGDCCVIHNAGNIFGHPAAMKSRMAQQKSHLLMFFSLNSLAQKWPYF